MNAHDLERYLLLANDLAGIDVRGTLSPGTTSGAAILTVNVSYNPSNLSIDLNNRGTREVGPERSQVILFINSLLGGGERITLSGATTPTHPSELTDSQLNLSIPIGYEGLRISLNNAYTFVYPGAQLRKFDINGNTYSASVGASYPFIRSRLRNLSVNGDFDLTNRQLTTKFTGTPETLNLDRLRVFRAGINYSQIDRQGSTSGGLQISQGIGGLGARTVGTADEPLSRERGEATFTKFNLNLTRSQSLSSGFTLELSGIAQISANPLLVSEQFGVGGEDFGRAFVREACAQRNPSQILGDDGYGLRAEIQRPFVYNISGTLVSTQPYIFYDYGQVFRKFPTAAENSSDALSSTGLGCGRV